jgi:hypothetical protein
MLLAPGWLVVDCPCNLGIVWGQGLISRISCCMASSSPRLFLVGPKVKDSHIPKFLVYANNCIVRLIMLIVSQAFVVFRG